MAKKGLNIRQTNFSLNILKGMDQGEAAVKAKYSKKTADATASRLLKNVKIIEFIAERKAKTIETTDLTRERQVERLEDLYMKGLGKGDFKTSIAALKEQSKILGHYAPKKIKNVSLEEILNERTPHNEK